ncbi:hypothetical protein ATO2_02390 [Roseovarius sp. 22II1-1F6A]|nr:hypothetical protein ATO2_02390 [Roseovarius sp. 22II1-1F6A]
MPYEWIPHPPDGQPLPEAGPGTPPLRLHAWPYRSLSRRGFVGFIGATFVLLMVPLMPALGTPVAFALLPFLLGALALLYMLLQRNQRDGEMVEELTLTAAEIRLTRHNPRAAPQDWHAHPHWTRLTLHPRGGPVPHYLTLHGNGREVELGAFLTPAERETLHGDLTRALAAARAPAHLSEPT